MSMWRPTLRSDCPSVSAATGLDAFSGDAASRTPLRACLTTKAPLFTPKTAAVTTANTVEAKVSSAIREAFGNNIKEIATQQGGLMNTIQVVLWESESIDESTAYWSASERLTSGLQLHCNNLESIEASADFKTVHLSALDATTTGICWEYVRCGCCPRYNCRWEHAQLISLVINIAFAALGHSEPCVPTTTPCSQSVSLPQSAIAPSLQATECGTDAIEVPSTALFLSTVPKGQSPTSGSQICAPVDIVSIKTAKLDWQPDASSRSASPVNADDLVVPSIKMDEVCSDDDAASDTTKDSTCGDSLGESHTTSEAGDFERAESTLTEVCDECKAVPKGISWADYDDDDDPEMLQVLRAPRSTSGLAADDGHWKSQKSTEVVHPWRKSSRHG